MYFDFQCFNLLPFDRSEEFVDFSTNYSKFHHLQKFILMEFPKIVQPRKFIPAKYKRFAVRLNRETFFL